jgi:hypothetical protein
MPAFLKRRRNDKGSTTGKYEGELMAGTRGYFKNGQWVEEKISEERETSGKPDGKLLEKRIDEVSSSVSRTLGDVISLARDLVVTKEGHMVVQKKIDEAGKSLDSAIHDMIAEAKKSTEPAKKADSGDPKKEIKIK